MTDTVDTRRPLPDELVTFGSAARRIAEALEGELLLGDADPRRGYPSPYAWDLMVRVATLSAIPGAHENDGSPQARAFNEYTSVLGAYVRRLEDVARQLAAQQQRCAGCPHCTAPDQ